MSESNLSGVIVHPWHFAWEEDFKEGFGGTRLFHDLLLDPAVLLQETAGWNTERTSLPLPLFNWFWSPRAIISSLLLLTTVSTARLISDIVMSTFVLSVNGTDHHLDADPEMPLLWVLRDLLCLTGTKYGCGMGVCGPARSTKMAGRSALVRLQFRPRKINATPPSRGSLPMAIIPASALGSMRMSPSVGTVKRV